MKSSKEFLTPKSIKTHLLENKGKISLFFLGYLMLVLDHKQVYAWAEIFYSISLTSFVILYISMIVITYSYAHMAIKMYSNLILTKKNFTIKNFNTGFVIISMGSLLGLFTNIMNALIIVTFSKYIIG